MTMRIIAAMTIFASAAAEAPMPRKPAEAGVGRYVPDIAFTGGKLSEFAGKDYLVVAFTNTTCPLCLKYVPTWQKLEQDYASKSVAFLFVNPTDESAKSPFAGKYVCDAKMASHFGAETTTDVFVLDARRTIVYRGAVDDQYGIGYATDAPKREYLRNAIDALLAGKTPDVRATTAPGCKLDLPKATSRASCSRIASSATAAAVSGHSAWKARSMSSSIAGRLHKCWRRARCRRGSRRKSMRHLRMIAR
jgi:thiol-disulfide isomerase/thioredoxin